METVNMHEAKTHLSRLVHRASQGETILIARSGRAVARLMPLAVEDEGTPTRLGFLSGQVSSPDDFDTMAADEIAAGFADA